MKKFLTVTVLFVMIALSCTSVKAMSSEELAEKLYSMGVKYGITAADKVRIERYLDENPVTETEANALVAKAEEAVKVMEDAGTTNYNKLTDAQKDVIKEKAKEAGQIVDATVVVKKNAVSIVKDGKVLVTIIKDSNGKLSYTGNKLNTTLVASAVAVIALSTAIVIKRRTVNE